MYRLTDNDNEGNSIESLQKMVKSAAKKVTNIVCDCNRHHHTKSCRKYHTTCRFNVPHFPTKETIIAIPISKISEYADIDDDFSKFKNIDKEKIRPLAANYQKILDKVQKNLEEKVSDFENQYYGDYDNLSLNSSIDKLLEEAGTNWNDYKTALKISFSGGYKIVLKRHVKEILMNSYNPNWSLAWNANLDLQICLDYHAVITYITDYFSKDDTGTLQYLKEAAKQFGRESLREKLNIIKNVFITHRQMGEAEAIYRLLPSLHFKESNLATKFIHAGFPENRSKFLLKLNEQNAYMAFGREVLNVDGKDDQYVEKISNVSKYERRDVIIFPELDSLSISQYTKEYEPTNSIPKKFAEMIDKKHSNENTMVEHLSSERFIHTSEGLGKPLPKYFPLCPSFPGESKYMRLRSHPAALRFYKGQQNNHEFFYNEIFLYTPFRKETNSINDNIKGLKEYYDDEDLCRKFYNSGLVQIVKQGVMEHLESVTDGRRRVDESEEANKMVGSILDNSTEQDNDDCKTEGVVDHPEHLSLDPGEFLH